MHLKILHIHITWVIFQQFILRDMKPVTFIVRIQSPSSKSAKLRALRAKNVLACQRVFCAYMLTCQRALCAYVLTCQRAFRAYMLMCQRVLRAYVLTCRRVLHVYVLMPCVLCVLTCQHALHALRVYLLMCYN